MSSNPPFAPLPTLARRPGARSHDGLGTGPRRVVIGAIAVGHVAAIWGVLQVPAVREAVNEVAPMFVELVAPPKPAPEPPPPPVLKAPPPRILAAPPKPAEAPAPFTVEAPPPEPPAPAPVQQVEAPPAPPAPAPAPPPPVVIPASAVRLLVQPTLVYPRASQRLNETGTVLLNIFIDERGLPAQVRVKKSSGVPRLDEAAVLAYQRARFEPYTVNGQPVAGWASIPIEFVLEK